MSETQSIWDRASQLADVYGQYIDEPLQPTYSNPTFGDDPRFTEFLSRLNSVLPGFGSAGYNPQQFGTLQNPPQYRGIRMLLPESMPVTGQPSEDSYNALQLNRIPDYQAIQQELYGELIKRGYPVRGGTGQFYGQEPGFNPIGFGQR